MTINLFTKLVLAVCVLNVSANALAQYQITRQPLLRPEAVTIPGNAASELPPGVPRIVDTNGRVVYINSRFTTKLYRNAAFDLVLKEANRVADELQLPGELPITESNIVSAYIGPFGYNYTRQSIGSITTSNYIYYVSQGNKFSYLEGTHQYEDCKNFLSSYTWPTNLINIYQAYQQATQWLAAASMDVRSLNHDCRVSVAIDTAYVKAPPEKFVPIYFVSWVPRNGIGDVASVRLFTPTKTLLQLRVEDPKYIQREPLVFTNLALLFPGIAPVHTNHPAQTIYMAAPPP